MLVDACQIFFVDVTELAIFEEICHENESYLGLAVIEYSCCQKVHSLDIAKASVLRHEDLKQRRELIAAFASQAEELDVAIGSVQVFLYLVVMAYRDFSRQ